MPIDPTVVSKVMKQKTWIYFLYTPLILTLSTNSTGYSANGMYRNDAINSRLYFIGPPIALGNFLLAAYANKQFSEEIKNSI